MVIYAVLFVTAGIAYRRGEEHVRRQENQSIVR
jgi:hypothetical protein